MDRSRLDSRRVLSRPAEVWWSGFRSNTMQLQQHGWQIAAEESVHYSRIRLMLRHPEMRIDALTNTLDLDYYRARFTHDSLVFRVVCVTPGFQFIRMHDVVDNFRQIDAMPQIVDQEIVTPDDLRIFATPLVRTEELIVEPKTVAELLEKIRRMQAPEQERIRAKERLARAREGMNVEAGPRQQFHAQVVSIADYKGAA